MFNRRDPQRENRVRNEARRYNFPHDTRTTSMTVLQRFLANEHRNERRVFRYRAHRSSSSNSYSGETIFRVLSGVSEIRQITLEGLQSDLEDMFEGILQRTIIAYQLRNDDFMQVQISDRTTGLFVQTRYQHVSNISVHLLFDLVREALQSAEAIDVSTMRVAVIHGYQRRGGSYCEMFTSADNFVKRKSSCTRIRNVLLNDCFFQCLALCMARKSENDKLFKSLTKYPEKRSEYGCRLREKANLHGVGQPVSLNDLTRYESFFELSIMVVAYSGMRIIKSVDNECDLCLLFVDGEDENIGHFHYVNPDKVGSLWSYRKFCFVCQKGYQDQRHKCIQTCIACKSCECVGKNIRNIYRAKKICKKCNMSFFNNDCFKRHLKSLCKKEKKCNECGRVYKKSKDKHVCGYVKCYNCKCLIATDENHECYHQPLDDEALKSPSDLYIFYDYECMVNESGLHIVAGVVAMYGNDETCYRFESNDDFIDWLFRPVHKGYTAIAHNGGRYDLHFIKSEMIKRGIPSSDVAHGRTIFYSYCKGFDIRFIDSYKLISVGLRKFPKTFGLTELAKGYFPYRFFTPERREYVGRMPGVEWFDFDSMKGDERRKALIWYEEHRDDEICLYEMCMKYCESDVLLLKEGCLKFRALFLSITQGKIDPLQYITIASVCMVIYRHFFLRPNTIGILNTKSIYSIEAERALYFEYRTKQKVWQYVVPGRKDIIQYGNLIIGLINCFDNGCKKCFLPHKIHPTKFIKMHELNFAFQSLLNRLYSWNANCKFEIFWGCEYEKKLEDSEYCLFVEQHSSVLDSLCMRNAFFGGRTEPIKLYKKANENERILYRDFTSLYPTVQFGEMRGITNDNQEITREVFYPIGHPQIINGRQYSGNIFDYFGFIYCEVVPPANLYIPLLPVKSEGKLIFDNCERAGTWTTVEVQKAVELGYKISKVYEIYHFERKSNTLFREYVKMFLRLKQQAKGWERMGCTTEDEKDVYISFYENHQGIRLKKEEINEYNAGLYFISKLCLNSLWGKFAQRDLFTNTVDTFSREEFEKVAHSDENIVHSVVLHNGRVRTVTFQKRKEFISNPAYTNIAIAAFTTAYARLRLYEALEETRENTLYMDTDSVIYIDNNVNLVTGELLGDLTDELDEGTWITEFVSTGPKSYAYKLNNGKTVCKVKGFSLGYATSKIINFHSLKRAVYDGKEIMTRPLQFIIGEKHDITTRQWKDGEGKKFKLTFDKRIVERGENEINTKPFS